MGIKKVLGGRGSVAVLWEVVLYKASSQVAVGERRLVGGGDVVRGWGSEAASRAEVWSTMSRYNITYHNLIGYL